MGAAECGRVAVWAAGLFAVGVAGALLVVLPRDREGINVVLAEAVAVGVFGTVAWCVVATCGAG